MGMFPAIDPIPLPAPVMIFKVLHLLTLTLHFTAVYVMIGSLIMGTVWAIMSRNGKNPAFANAAKSILQPLPIVMTYVINLAIPPLLFTQVLYGRALFASSVAMGTWWISVIGFLMLAYYLLYVIQRRFDYGKTNWWLSLIVLAIVIKIAFIYVNNMTLMLRPESWLEMFRSSSGGGHLADGDPTIYPRWMYMIIAALAIMGIGVLHYGMGKSIAQPQRTLFNRWGAAMTIVGGILLISSFNGVLISQPNNVKEGLANIIWYKNAVSVWYVTLFGMLLFAVLAFIRAKHSVKLWGMLLSLLGFLNIASWVVIRDGIRDLTLVAKGFNVMDREVVTNWGVVGLFGILFIVGLVVTIWMARIAATANSEEKQYA